MLNRTGELTLPAANTTLGIDEYSLHEFPPGFFLINETE
jgi:hypothetical protein